MPCLSLGFLGLDRAPCTLGMVDIFFQTFQRKFYLYLYHKIRPLDLFHLQYTDTPNPDEVSPCDMEQDFVPPTPPASSVHGSEPECFQCRAQHYVSTYDVPGGHSPVGHVEPAHLIDEQSLGRETGPGCVLTDTGHRSLQDMIAPGLGHTSCNGAGALKSQEEVGAPPS